jgi:hypothetical protein
MQLPRPPLHPLPHPPLPLLSSQSKTTAATRTLVDEEDDPIRRCWTRSRMTMRRLVRVIFSFSYCTTRSIQWLIGPETAALAHYRCDSYPSSSIRTIDNPAAAAFIENETAADSHWWLDEQDVDDDGHPITDNDEEEDDEDMEQGSEQKNLDPSHEVHLTHGLGNRNYSLQIEFDANFGATENDGE